jgi:RNA polymerase sigma factor for flagellar operon FliA
MNAESYLPFVRKIANRIARRVPHSVEIDDLMGAGTVGLLEALDRFDPDSGRSFETYAEFRVKGAILDELRRADPLNRTARSTQRRVAAKTAQLTSTFGRPPETEEVAAAMNTSVDAFMIKMSPLDSYRHVPIDLDAIGPEGEIVTQEDLLGKQEIVRLVRESVSRLTQRQQLVLSLYYVEELSQSQIGEMLGVTESRVCQILGETVKALRSKVSHATA